MNLLIFAYVFPPDASSGVHRTLHFANHWARSDDAVTVITVATGGMLPDAPTDPGLCDRIESSIDVVRTRIWRPLPAFMRLRERLRRLFGRTRTNDDGTPAQAGMSAASRSPATRLKDALSSILTFPDAQSGWIPHAVKRGIQLARERRIDCIYASGGPWSTLVAAAIAAAVTRIPLVLDFRDPWYSNPNLLARARMIRAASRWCEARCVRRARLVVANTEESKDDFIRRYPRVPPETFLCVPNGFEAMPPQVAAPQDRFTLVHAGALYLSRDPRPFLTALAGLLERGELRADAIRVRFLGGLDTADPDFETLLTRLSGVVEILPRLPHAEALRIQQQASALLLFQSGFPLQVPRKLYEYLSLRLPVLAVTESGGATARVLRELKFGCVTENEAGAIALAIARMHREWRDGTTAPIDPDGLDRYDNRRLADSLRRAMAQSIG